MSCQWNRRDASPHTRRVRLGSASYNVRVSDACHIERLALPDRVERHVSVVTRLTWLASRGLFAASVIGFFGWIGMQI